MADGQEAEETLLREAREWPYAQRVADRNWKIRRDAYVDAKAASQRGIAPDSGFGGMLAKGLGDANAAAQDAALEALQSYLAVCDEAQAAQIAEPACANIATKVLKQRVHTVAKGTEVCLAFIELEQGEVVMTAITKAFDDKVPKTVQAAAVLAEKAVSTFGLKAIPPKPLFAALPKLFDSKQGPVRDAAKSITVLACRWLGMAAVEPTLIAKMSDIMRKDVEKAVADAPGKPQPERLTRKEAAKAAAQQEVAVPGASGEAAAPTAGLPAAVEEEEEGVDAYDISDPVDILPELRTFDDEVANTAKWSARRDILTKLKTLAAAPHLAPGDFGDVLRRLKVVITKDSNVVCVAEAISCVGALAKGLRRDFHSSAKSFAPVLLDKFKDKNTGVCRATNDALVIMHKYCFSLSDVAEDYATVAAGKLPKPKLGALQVLRTAVSRAPAKEAAKAQAVLAPPLARAAMEPAPDVREAALQALVAIATTAKDAKGLARATDKVLDDKRRKLLADMVAGSGGSATGASTPAASAAPSTTASSRAPSQVGSLPTSPRSSQAGAAPAARNAAPRARTTSAAASGPADDDDASLSAGAMDRLQAEERLTALFGDTVVPSLVGTNWKERLETMAYMQEKIEEDPNKCEASLIHCVSFIPGWAEKNFQVFGKMIQLMATVAQNCSTVNKRDAFVAISGLVDKLSDAKLKTPAGELLSALAEAVGPQFVATQLHKKASLHKSPKVLSEALGWIATAVDDFGVAMLDVRHLISWCIADLESRDAAVRSAAVMLLARAHRQLGPGLADMVRTDVKPAQLATIEEAFAANPLQAVVPSRHIRGSSANTAKGRRKGVGSAQSEPADAAPAAAAADPADLLPRTDISVNITDDLLRRLASANWKERAAGLEAVDGMLAAAGGRIGPNVGDLMGALKARLNDSNRNLGVRALLLLGALGRAMGPAVERAARQCLSPALNCLADKKKPVRDAVITMLDDWVGERGRVPLERLAPAMHDAAVAPKMSPEGRTAAIAWLGGALAAEQGARSLDTGLRIAVFAAADKSSAVREGGNTLVKQMVEAHGGAAVLKAAQSLGGGQKAPALQLLAKHEVQPGSGMAAAVQAAPAAVVSPGRPTTAAADPDSPQPDQPRRPATAFPNAPLLAPAAEEPPQPLLQRSTKKEARLRGLHFKGGKFESPRPEEEDMLRAEFTPLASPALRAALFGKDFTRHIAAIDMLLSALADDFDAVLAALDLVFRWVVLRLCEGNMQALVKVCELTNALLNTLYENGYKLADAEAHLLLPCLVEKAGHSQERIRAQHRELLKACCGVFESQRVCEFLVLGLQSKNNRTRTEAIEVLGELIDQEGIIVYQGARYKPLPAIAQLVTDKDRGVRAAALGVMEVAYRQEGPAALWKLVGRLSDQQHSLIEERLKYTDKQASAQGMEVGYKRAERLGRTYSEYGEEQAQPSDAGYPGGYGNGYAGGSYYGAADPSHPLPPPHYDAYPAHDAGGYGNGASFAQRSAPSEASYHSGDGVPPSSQPDSGPAYGSTPVRLPPQQSAPYAYMATPGQPHYASMPTPVPSATPAVFNETDKDAEPLRPDDEVEAAWEEGLMLLNHRKPDKQVEGIKNLGGELSEMMDGRISPVMEARFAQDANSLVATLSRRLRAMFTEAFVTWEHTRRPPSHRKCKYTVSLLMRLFSVPLLAHSVASDTLRDFVSAMLLTLIDGRVLEIQEGGNLMKALNVLMLKTLENSNRTYAFTALLLLTREPPPELRHKPAEAAKFFDLAVKCLIKISKALSDDLQEIECSMVLMAVDEFFRQLGLTEIRRRSTSDDKPLRMVKTLLHELCKKKGMAILEDMTAISEEEPLPIIRAYIDLNLLTLHQAGLISGPLPPRIARRVQSISGDAGQVALAAGTPHAANGQQQQQHGGATTPAGSGSQLRSGTPGSAQSPVEQELKRYLVAALDQLGQRPAGTQGMEALHEFLQRNPGVDLQPFLAGANERLRTYFYEELRQVAERQGTAGEEAYRTPQQPPSAKMAFATDANGEQPGVSNKPNSVDVLKERLNRLPPQPQHAPSGITTREGVPLTFKPYGQSS